MDARDDDFSLSIMRCRVNMDGSWAEVPPQFYELLGYPKQELKKRSFEEIIHPDDKDPDTEVLGAMQRGEEQEFDRHLRLIANDGHHVWVHLSGAVIRNKHGEAQYVRCSVHNLTDAKLTLKQTNQSFRSLFEHNPHPVYYFDQQGNFQDFNQKLVEFTGYSREELLQTNFRSFIVEEDLERTITHFNESLDGEAGEYEIQVIIKGGIKKDIRVTNFPRYIGDEITGVFGILQDITDEKKAQNKLKESEERWQRLVEDGPQPVQIVQDGTIVFINQQGAELYGASAPQELIGESIHTLMHPDSLDNMQDRKQRLEDRQQIPPGEHRIIRLDGQERYIEVHSIPIRYEGKNAIQTVIHDITQRKQVEKALKRTKDRMSRLFSNLPGMAYRCKNEERWPMVFVSDGVKQLTGFKPELFTCDDEQQIFYGDLIHEDDRAFVWNEVQNAIKNDTPFEIEYRITDKDNNQRWVWERGVPVQSREEGVLLLEGFISDISKQKLAEQKIRDNLEKKEILLQEIHHRVKNNLAVISGLLELQLMNTGDEAIVNTLRQSQMRIQSMAMIHQKLYQSEALSDVGFDQYVRELIQTIQRTYDFSDQRIDVVFDLQPVSLDIDKAIPSALILNELVANCFEHAFDEQQKGTVRIVLEQEEQRQVLLHVIDNGNGLGEDFDIESEQTLGMTLIKTLASQLGGELEVGSGPEGAGTRIAVRFSLD